MELPVVSTSYCDDLRHRLESLLGPDTVAVVNGAESNPDSPK